MPGMALSGAAKGRLRPSFFFLLGVLGSAWAQDSVYRCGNLYTNAPQDASRCERVATQAVTVIEGTRAQGPQHPASPATPAASPAPPVGGAADKGHQSQRDDMARHIISTELAQARQRHAQLLDEYQQGHPARTAEEQQNPQKYRERVARLQAALERSQRDIDSLQRELTRRPTASAKP